MALMMADQDDQLNLWQTSATWLFHLNENHNANLDNPGNGAAVANAGGGDQFRLLWRALLLLRIAAAAANPGAEFPQSKLSSPMKSQKSPSMMAGNSKRRPSSSLLIIGPNSDEIARLAAWLRASLAESESEISPSSNQSETDAEMSMMQNDGNDETVRVLTSGHQPAFHQQSGMIWLAAADAPALPSFLKALHNERNSNDGEWLLLLWPGASRALMQQSSGKGSTAVAVGEALRTMAAGMPLFVII